MKYDLTKYGLPAIIDAIYPPNISINPNGDKVVSLPGLIDRSISNHYIVPEEAKTRPKRAVLCIEIIVSAKMERIHFPALQQWVTIYNVAIENTGFTWGDSIFIFARK